MKDLPHADETDVDVEVLEREVKTCANILKILSQELYHVDRYARMLSFFIVSGILVKLNHVFTACIFVSAYLVKI